MATATPDTATAAVTVRGLRKTYGTVHAVDGLDLDVPVGGIFGLIGPNGAGKTTTMQALVTLLVPDGGQVQVFGHDPVADPFEVRRQVGWMPDFFGLYDGLTCREYLDFFAAAYRLDAPTRRQQVADLLELVELTHKADTDTAGLSRGMQQRLSLARALVHDPRLLVLDEPASGLDPRARVELREILLELSRLGHTILVSSHILAELQEICDRVGIIEAGRVLAQGTVEEIRATVRSVLTVTVRVLGGPEVAARAAAIAAANAAVQTAGPTGTLRFELAGGEEAAADLLAALVGEGIRVTDFREESGGLERLFLSVTKGDVR
jgi:ABC-2 type transport system ATP-binding protein